MAEQHFHSCPECYKHDPCTLDCAIEADLSEGWNEQTQEFARPFGATTECDDCTKKPPAGWQSELPTLSGNYWLSIAPDKRRNFPAVISCIIRRWSEEGLRLQYTEGGDHLDLSDPWFSGALWKPRETPEDPFKCSRSCSECDGHHHRLPDDTCTHCEARLPPEEL